MEKHRDAIVHVVAAAVMDHDGRVLLTERPPGKHLAGYWEFPGGKKEATETSLQALSRELHEEVGLDVIDCRPLIDVVHAYPEKTVRLEVWRVDGFQGDIHGREGQRWAWADVGELAQWQLPPADVPIVKALQLPDTYCITPEPEDSPAFWRALEATLERGERLLQLRAKQMEPNVLERLARRFITVCHSVGAKVLVNANPARAADMGADGAHLSAAIMRSFTGRQSADGFMLAASCHDKEELTLARQLGADFAVLGPVAPTASHPGQPALGWHRFNDLVRGANLPVYALGGMQREDVGQAWHSGGQGVAGISGLWG